MFHACEGNSYLTKESMAAVTFCGSNPNSKKQMWAWPEICNMLLSRNKETDLITEKDYCALSVYKDRNSA